MLIRRSNAIHHRAQMSFTCKFRTLLYQNSTFKWECPLHPAERDLLRKVSPELDPKILLDTKKGLGAVVKFLDSLPQLLCWWFAWLSSLLRFYWVSISGIELLGVMYLRFPLAHGYFHGKFGAIERLNLLRALTPLLCQSHRDKCFWNFMSSLYIVLFCKFYVTVWCKDNKLIIYLSIYLQVHLTHLMSAAL